MKRVVTPERILVTLCLLFAAAMFTTGITWGLPSRAADAYLFGSRTPWTGQEIIALTGDLDANSNKGADVDLNPLPDRTKPLLLNGTDAERAEIVRRYRLFTHQPDEWNTMRSLAGMKPGEFDLDPKLYQYGGLWVYPVGALLKIVSIAGGIELKSDLAYYLDHPEVFSRFYIIARLYSAAWGVLGAWAVYMLARKLTAHATPAAFASACWSCMPVIVTMSHEAKPHLAGLVLMLLAILAASRFVETGSQRWWTITGALCGAAFGMVISSAIIFVVLPVMTMLRPLEWRERFRVTSLSSLIGFGIYAITNPFVWINLIWNREVLRSNLGTSTAMYETTGSGVGNALRLIGEGMSIPLAIVGTFGAFFLLRRTLRVRLNIVWLLAVPGLVVLAMFVVLAKGKPGEYARFALLTDTVLCLFAIGGCWRAIQWRWARAVVVVTLGLCVTWRGTVYLAHFAADTHLPTSRLVLAEHLQQLSDDGVTRIAIIAEPAPYVMPPVDLWKWRVELLPPGKSESVGNSQIVLRATDHVPQASLTPDRRGLLRSAAPISWAAKPFEVRVVRAGRADAPVTSPSQAPAAP